MHRSFRPISTPISTPKKYGEFTTIKRPPPTTISPEKRRFWAIFSDFERFSRGKMKEKTGQQCTKKKDIKTGVKCGKKQVKFVEKNIHFL